MNGAAQQRRGPKVEPPKVLAPGQTAPDRARIVDLGADDVWSRPDLPADATPEQLRKQLAQGGKLGRTHELHGAHLVAHNQEQQKWADAILDAWWSQNKGQATDEAKQQRKRETAEPYPVELWADRVERSAAMKPPARIFDSLVTSDCVNIIYGYMNQGKSVIAEVVALIAAGERIEGVQTDPGQYWIILIDLEQPHISQQKWAPFIPMLRKYGIKVVALGDEVGGVDRDRLFVTCRQAQRDGINFCIMDNLNRFFRLDVSKEAECKKEMEALHEHVFQFFPHNLAAHHTTKQPAGPVTEIPYMAGSHIIADYVQGNLVFTARSWRDPNVVTFTHFKSKWTHIMETYEREQGRTFALRRMGFNGDGLPFEFESKDLPFDYWQKRLSDEELIQEAKELHPTKKEQRMHLEKNGKPTSTAYRWLGDKKKAAKNGQ
jgi:hypothetical protein